MYPVVWVETSASQSNSGARLPTLTFSHLKQGTANWPTTRRLTRPSFDPSALHGFGCMAIPNRNAAIRRNPYRLALRVRQDWPSNITASRTDADAAKVIEAGKCSVFTKAPPVMPISSSLLAYHSLRNSCCLGLFSHVYACVDSRWGSTYSIALTFDNVTSYCTNNSGPGSAARWLF